jgi:hypothetical protein
MEGMTAIQKLLFLQPPWAMERHHMDGMERTREQNIRKILDARFDGVSTNITDAAPQRQNCPGFPSPNTRLQ